MIDLVSQATGVEVHPAMPLADLRRLAEQHGSGALCVPDPETSAGMLFSMVIAELQTRILIGELREPDDHTIETRVETAVGLFLKGALPRLARVSIEDVFSAVGRQEMKASDAVRAMYPDYKEERATLAPARTNALYFVARGDGSSQFSESLTEHNRAVSKYQLGGDKRQQGR